MIEEQKILDERIAHLKAEHKKIGVARLAHLESEHKARGDHGLILEAVFTCFFGRIPIPKWLSGAFMDAFLRFQGGEVGSWDDLFDKPIPKGAKRKAIRDRDRFSHRAYFLCREKIIAEASSFSSSSALNCIFEEVAEEMGFGTTKIKEWYYENKGIYSDMEAELRKKYDQVFSEEIILEVVKRQFYK